MDNPKLKYCGVRNIDDLKLVSQSQANYIGFIFAESKRKVKPAEVKKWLEDVDVKDKMLVAVVVNPTSEELQEVIKKIPVDVIQFHGNESLEQIKKVQKQFGGLVIWKALHHHENTLKQMEEFIDTVDGFVIDSRIKGAWGGTGVSFDWKAAPQYINYAMLQNKDCFIAGGINEKNISRLLELQPQGIDLSSGIEEDEKKNKAKIQQIEERMLQYVNLSR
ncbi:phosphoribosylanthranilate isomerase [Metabacillus crassostreae]|uniref:phosphoribosylanthranilate isomerase n=1 Tax=Metabacillus crassostreae TaxID=929098 RepID=UPI00195CC554|nr:phosphoribosylanthranilate isomerase [Metabacillus crassostreae]MBM7604420.1 phosphoribosylanthranilate isomerase [Metabacillus crassostreae]